MSVLAAVVLTLAATAPAAAPAKNMFSNGGFELGRSFYTVDRAGKTVADFTVDSADAREGRHSALVTVGAVEDWGVQFGQYIDAAPRGSTCTFAVFVRSVGGPVELGLTIERRAKPWDKAGPTRIAKVGREWAEMHATFKVERDFSQGWFAYVSCRTTGAKFRVDAFRLYQGEYVPYEKMVAAAGAAGGVRVFDTGRPAAEPPAGEVVARCTGWREVPAGKTDHKFAGDAAMVNARLAVILRRDGGGGWVYSLGGGGADLRAGLMPVQAGPAAPLGGLSVVASSATGASLRAMTVQFDLSVGQPFVETTAPAGVAGLRIEAPARFLVMPDFFADDIVIDAPAVPGGSADLPTDHFLLHMLAGGAGGGAGGEAVLMTVSRSGDADATVRLAGSGEGRRAASVDIPYGNDPKGRKVWVAVLAGQGIWHVRDLAAADRGRIIPLDWTAPFPAIWRVDFTRDDRLTDSWDSLARRPDGQFTKSGWFGSDQTLPPDRKRWTTVLGNFQYPCWLDEARRGHLQPLRQHLRFQGPAVMYPINRSAATPLEEFTVVDVARATLGVGPCEYVLDVEGQRDANKGRATCSNRDTLEPIYKSGRQKSQRATIEKSLTEVIVFIRHIRGRIEEYVNFGHRLLEYLAEQKRAHAELAGPIGELERLARVIDAKFAARKGPIKTPAYAQGLADEFRKELLDYEGADALAKCMKYTRAWVEIGSNQDELVGECRWAAKMIRQRAALLAAGEPRLAEIAREVRARTQQVMRNPAGHEGARH